MELKLKEGVDLSLLTTQHNIETIVVNLLDETAIHLGSETEIQLMIAIVNELVEENVYNIIQQLNNTEIVNYIKEQIEPLFMEWVNSEEHYNIYDKMKTSIILYLNSKYKEANSVIGLLQNVVDTIQTLSPEDLQNMQKMVNNYSSGIIQKKAEDKIEDTKKSMSTKMEELIQSYSKEPTNK